VDDRAGLAQVQNRAVEVFGFNGAVRFPDRPSSLP